MVTASEALDEANARRRAEGELRRQGEFVRRWRPQGPRHEDSALEFEAEFRAILYAWGEVMAQPFRDTLTQAAALGFKMSEAMQQPRIIVKE